MLKVSFPGGSDDKESAYNAGDMVQSLGQEKPLEKGMATSIFSSILPGESHGQSSLASYSPWGCKESDSNEQLTLSGSLELR